MPLLKLMMVWNVNIVGILFVLRGIEKMKYQLNRGENCSVSGCNNYAKVKGFCMGCYHLKRAKLRKE